MCVQIYRGEEKLLLGRGGLGVGSWFGRDCKRCNSSRLKKAADWTAPNTRPVGKVRYLAQGSRRWETTNEAGSYMLAHATWPLPRTKLDVCAQGCLPG